MSAFLRCSIFKSNFSIIFNLMQPSVEPPSVESMQKISNLILHLQEAELPLAKLEILLSVISTSIEATTMSQRGQALGADDFLPLLVYIVGKCGFIGAEIEAEFMWCLLQPSLLNGEAGYYLTALSSATHVLKTFKSSAHAQDGTEHVDVSVTSTSIQFYPISNCFCFRCSYSVAPLPFHHARPYYE